ncbi:MAG: helix-turn-helix domain-containing protein [Gemmataceae bacterium]
MPQQYYTLEQAAQLLRINAEQLKEMARKKEIRAFQDRSGWRFRSQEIDEMARERGFGSDPELPLGEAAKVKTGDAASNEVFNFRLEGDDSEEVPLGKDPAASDKPSRSGSGPRKTSASKSPPPKASSDSDVRLVLDGSEGNLSLDAGSSKTPTMKGPVSPAPKVGSSKSRLPPPVQDDSGVRIVPLDQPSDSNVKIEPSSPHDSDAPTVGKKTSKKSSDSDIRIEEVGQGGKVDQMLTEEIDLDAEQRKADVARAKTTRHRPKPGSSPALPTISPFELSESEIDVKKGAQGKRKAPRTEEVNTDSSSDFELKPMADSSSPLELGSDEMPALSDEVQLGEWTGGKGASGISLQDPADSGISLEPEPSAAPAGESDSSSDFELNVPENAKGGESSSDFELSLQDEDASPVESSSSEFELNLDSEGSDLAVEEGSSDLAVEGQGSDSDSEFELTLDDSGGLSLEDGAASESDDFDVPSLDDDSHADAAALEEDDTNLESSEFDLSLEGEESGSQVVPLEDEEEYDEGAATVQRKAAGVAAAEDEEGLEDLGEALDDDLDGTPAAEDEVEPVTVAAAPEAPADWGVVFPLLSLVCTIVLFFVGLMSFELMQSMWGYHTGNKVSTPIVRFFAPMFPGGDKLPDN